MKTLVLLFFLFLSSSLLAQNEVTDSTASVAGFWNKNEVKTLHIRRAVIKYRDNKKTDEATASYNVHLNIIDSATEGYTFEWTYKNIESTELKNSVNPLDALMEGLKIVYKTDENGSFTKVENLKEIQTFISKSVDVLIARNSDPKYKTVLEQLRKSFSTEQAIETVFLREVRLYHTPYGNIYKLKEKISYEQQLPNVITGDPFPAFTTLELTTLDASKDFCQLVMDMHLDKVKGMEILKGVIRKLMSGSEIKFKDEDLPNQIVMSDHNEFDVILSSGWLSRAYLNRVVDIMGSKKVEVYEITLKN